MGGGDGWRVPYSIRLRSQLPTIFGWKGILVVWRGEVSVVEVANGIGSKNIIV